jgi:hypothetical protein
MYKASVCFDFTIFNVIVKPIKHYNVSEYVCTYMSPHLTQRCRAGQD